MRLPSSLPPPPPHTHLRLHGGGCDLPNPSQAQVDAEQGDCDRGQRAGLPLEWGACAGLGLVGACIQGSGLIRHWQEGGENTGFKGIQIMPFPKACMVLIICISTSMTMRGYAGRTRREGGDRCCVPPHATWAPLLPVRVLNLSSCIPRRWSSPLPCLPPPTSCLPPPSS